MGTFDSEGNYTPRKVTERDVSFADSINETMVELKEGKLVTGTVVRITRDEVLVEIGYKTEGVILNRELSIRQDADPNTIVKLGEKIETLILTLEDKEGRLLLSKKRAQYERAWGDIEKVKNNDGTVEGVVIEAVKGGLIVDIGLRGFLPASLVELRRVRDLAPYLGQRITAKILELDRQRNNVVLSRRALLEQSQKGDGLIHVSEMSWKHVDNPSEVVKIGDEVSVKVLEIDRERDRISLSLKATQQDPWQEFASSHQVGQLVYGRVTKLVPFGGFVQVGDGIEGLVHISEMSTHHVEAPEQVVTPSEELWVKIIDLDLARRRISLSIKQAAEGGELAEEYRGQFQTDEQGNWVSGDDSSRESAWAEFFDPNAVVSTDAPAVEVAEAPATETPQ
ncbi:MAG: S1 RNA-binding domain-containing protein [Actinobacteria bacterium]|nr:S1 RNA-binding domain-containing protein [Actinomycetota bacterium]